MMDFLPVSVATLSITVFFLKIFLFTFLAMLGLSCGTRDVSLQLVRSGSLTRDQTRASCIGSTVS